MPLPSSPPPLRRSGRDRVCGPWVTGYAEGEWGAQRLITLQKYIKIDYMTGNDDSVSLE